MSNGAETPSGSEREFTALKEKIQALTGNENANTALRACKLYYDVLCDEEALGREASRQHGRPLKIVFRGREIIE